MRKASLIPWTEIEQRYANLFPSKTGNPAKPLRMALGSLIIQKQYSFSDRELVEQITENPYYQYFIGLPGYQQEVPFAPSVLVELRKRLTDEILGEINEMILAGNHPDDHDNNGSPITPVRTKQVMTERTNRTGQPSCWMRPAHRSISSFPRISID